MGLADLLLDEGVGFIVHFPTHLLPDLLDLLQLPDLLLIFGLQGRYLLVDALLIGVLLGDPVLRLLQLDL